MIVNVLTATKIRYDSKITPSPDRLELIYIVILSMSFTSSFSV